LGFLPSPQHPFAPYSFFLASFSFFFLNPRLSTKSSREPGVAILRERVGMDEPEQMSYVSSPP